MTERIALCPRVYVDNATVPTDKLYCDSLEQRLAPDFQTASLRYRYGLVSSVSGVRRRVSPVLIDKLITITDANGQRFFEGIVKTQTDAPDGTLSHSTGDIPTGVTYYQVVSLDFLLDRTAITSSYFTDFIAKTAFAFNGEGRDLEKNRSKTFAAQSYLFTQETDGENWTSLQIIQYLLANFATGYTWRLAGQYEALNAVTPQLDPAGKTVRQCLNMLLSRQTGYAWYAARPVNEPTVVEIIVVPLTDTEVKVDDTVVIPANSSTGVISEAFETGRYIDAPRVNRVESSAYSQIRVYSEPVRVMGTFVMAVSDQSLGLAGDWAAADKTAYDSASDLIRQDERFDRVFQQYSLTSSWDCTDYNASPLVPQVDPATAAVTLTENKTAHMFRAFDRNLPLKRSDGHAGRQDYRPPFLLLKYGDAYVISDKAVDSMKIGMTVLDRKPGILLRCPYNHATAKNHFTASSEFTPIYDIEDCLVTLAMRFDAPLEYVVDGAANGNGLTREIYVKGYEYWCAPSGTYTDRNTVLSSLTVYRDDSAKLKRFAAIAKAWYGRLRNTVTWSEKYVKRHELLGYMVSEVYTGGSFTPAGTVISSISYDFLAQRVDFATDYADLDFQQISARTVRNQAEIFARRLAELESRTENVPLRPVGGGESSSGYTGPFMVKDASDESGFIVNIYDGSDPDSNFAGYLQLNGNSFQVEWNFLTVSASGYVYLQSTWDDENDVPGTPEFFIDAGYPLCDESNFRKVLAKVVLENNSLTIYQYQYGDIHGFVIGDCNG